MKKEKLGGKGAEVCKAINWEEFVPNVDANGNPKEKADKKKKDEYDWAVDDVEETWSIDFDENGRRIEDASEDLSKNIVSETLNQIARDGVLKADGAFVTGEIDAKAVETESKKVKKKAPSLDEEAIRKSVDEKIIVRSEELKSKRVAKEGKKVSVPPSYNADGKKVKVRVKKEDAYRTKKGLEKYRKVGALPTKKNGPSDFRKEAAKWRYENVSKADTNDNDINETTENETFLDKLKDFTPIQYISAAMAVVLLVMGVMTTSVYADYRGNLNKREAFAMLPQFSDSNAVAYNEGYAAEEIFMEEAAEKPSDETSKNLSLVLTSVEKDLKIKLVDDEDTLVKDILWGVLIEDSKGESSEYEDEDEDGIIHLTGINAGDYTVSIMDTPDLEGYNFPRIGQEVSVKAKVEYKVIANIRDEIKKESEVNVALEDPNGGQAADVETGTVLEDTVAWVESTEVAAPDSDEYEEAEVDLSKTEKLVAFIDRVKESISGFAKSIDTVFSRDFVVAGIKMPGILVADEENQGGGDQAMPDFLQNIDWSAIQGQLEQYQQQTPAENTPTATPTVTPTPTVESSSSSSSSSMNESSTADVASVTIDRRNADLKIGQTITLNLKYSPAGALPANVRWDSTDPSVASVSDGKVKALAAGTTKVGAVVNNNIIVYCDVKVTSDDTASVSIEGLNGVDVGSSITLNGKCSPSEDTITEWISENTDIAKVSANGNDCVVTGVKSGEATIRATSSSGAQATFVITVVGETTYSDDAQLYDSNKNKLYVYENSQYRLAKYSDYKSGKFSKFYRKTTDMVYTGWQTIDGVTYYYTENHEKVTGDQVIGGVTYHFGSDGALEKGSGVLGIDVSKYQPSINWASVKASGINYVIIRCGYRGASTGSLIQDPYYSSHIKGAKAAGLKVGVYFFSTALNEAEAVEEASMCAELCSGYGINYPVFIDVEPSSRPGYNGLPVEQRTANIRAFCQTIQSAGYTPGLYANKTWLTSYINTSQLSCKIWLAQYNAAGPTYTGHYDLWQYTSKGKVDGISGNVDMNQSYLGY